MLILRLRGWFLWSSIVLRLTYRVLLVNSRGALEVWSFISSVGRWCRLSSRGCCCRNASRCRMTRVVFGWWRCRFVFVLTKKNRLSRLGRRGVLVVVVLSCCRRLFVRGRLFRLPLKSFRLGLHLGWWVWWCGVRLLVMWLSSLVVW